ncbi:MAG: extracellular solute-binding protein [Clostridia bacterium]
MKTQKIIALLCASLLLLFCLSGCRRAPQADNGAIPGALGRYMEEPVTLPLPEGATEQSLIGMCAAADGMVYFTCVYHGQDDAFYVDYFRHTVKIEGSVTTQKEQWLSDSAPKGGNELSLIRSDNGTLYFSYNDYDADGNTVPHILVSHDDGKTSETLTGTGVTGHDFILKLGVSTDGRIVVANMGADNLVVLDAQGNVQDELAIDRDHASHFSVSGDKVICVAPSGDAVRVYNLSDNSSVDFPFAISQGTVAFAVANDGAVYLANATGLFRHTADGTLWEQLVEGGVTSIGMPSYYICQLSVQSGEQNSLYVSGYADGSGMQVYRYFFDSEAAQTADIELNVFSLHASEPVQQAVVAFNRAHSEIRINYTVAMEQGGAGTEQDYAKALNTELLAGTGPDVLILDGLPIDSYTEKDVLLDLSTIVDGAEPVLPQIRRAYEQDGHLYTMPLGFGMLMALAKDGAETAFTSLETLASYQSSSGLPILSNTAFSYETLANMLLTYYGKDLLAGQAEAVRSFLENAALLKTNIRATDKLGAGWDIFSDMPGEELQQMLQSNSNPPQLFAFMTERVCAALLSIDSPSSENFMMAAAAAAQTNAALSSVNGQFFPVGLAGINRASKQPEAAALFLNTLLSKQVQNASNNTASFPVNLAALDAVLNYENPNISCGLLLTATDSLNASWPVPEQRERLRTEIDHLKTPLSMDIALQQMLLPEVTAYLDESVPLDAAVGKIVNLLSTYLAE